MKLHSCWGVPLLAEVAELKSEKQDESLLKIFNYRDLMSRYVTSTLLPELTQQ